MFDVIPSRENGPEGPIDYVTPVAKKTRGCRKTAVIRAQ